MILYELFVCPLSHQKELLAIPSVVSILGPSKVMYKYLHGPIRIYASHTLMGPRALYRPLRPFCNWFWRALRQSVRHGLPFACPCHIKQWPLWCHQRCFSWVHMIHSHLRCPTNNQSLRCHQQFAPLNQMNPYEYFESLLSHQEAVLMMPLVVHHPGYNEPMCQYRHPIMCLSWANTSYSYVCCPTIKMPPPPQSHWTFPFQSNWVHTHISSNIFQMYLG